MREGSDGEEVETREWEGKLRGEEGTLEAAWDIPLSHGN